MIARTPAPPYYAVIFTSLRRETEQDYATTAERMLELAQNQPGFLGVESARGADGLGITVSYWASEEAIRTWRVQAEHRVAQQRGREEWYRAFIPGWLLWRGSMDRPEGYCGERPARRMSESRGDAP